MKVDQAPTFRHADRLTESDPLQTPNWDSLLAQHPQAGPFHSAAWARVLQETYGYRPVYLVAKKDGRLDAVIPVMEVQSWLTGTRGVALPFTDSCEPLGCDAPLKRQIFSQLLEIGQQRKWKYLECRWQESGQGDVPGWNEFYSHHLPLNKDPQALFSKFDSATRRAINSAKKQGVTVEMDHSLAGIESFYKLHTATRQRHGLPPQPFRFFRNIHKHILSQKLGMVVLAKVKKVVVAAAVYFHFGTQAIYKFGASDLRFQNFRGNNAVMWEAIQWYCRNGYQSFDFGRSSIANDGLRRFKLGWGAMEQKSNYVRYGFQERRFLSGKDQAFGWHNRVFNHLPVTVSRIIGSKLYRHIA